MCSVELKKTAQPHRQFPGSDVPTRVKLVVLLSLRIFICTFVFSPQNNQLLITMKIVVVLSVLLCSAFAAPAEHKEKAPDGAETKKVEEEFVPEDSVPVPRNASVFQEAAAPEARFNYCPDGWYSHNSRCFIVVNTASTWFNAEVTLLQHFTVSTAPAWAHLASATNPREYAFLQEITKRSGVSNAWLGGFRLQSRWMWIDGQGLYYTNWYSQSSSSSCPACT
ncbi:hypothetical protein F7725_020064 [Dissostichus mawsoni]|uniref:C-type lectin domain-containing protein n=1 Tax=Dissostichus mawsoni TaxID=36200 RepID=A0A7J5YLM8_DISMA|nr:hypothetical protein F7725_020064 [Dissostichus mawsoni]